MLYVLDDYIGLKEITVEVKNEAVKQPIAYMLTILIFCQLINILSIFYSLYTKNLFHIEKQILVSTALVCFLGLILMIYGIYSIPKIIFFIRKKKKSVGPRKIKFDKNTCSIIFLDYNNEKNIILENFYICNKPDCYIIRCGRKRIYLYRNAENQKLLDEIIHSLMDTSTASINRK